MSQRGVPEAERRIAGSEKEGSEEPVGSFYMDLGIIGWMVL